MDPLQPISYFYGVKPTYLDWVIGLVSIDSNYYSYPPMINYYRYLPLINYYCYPININYYCLSTTITNHYRSSLSY